MSKLYIFTEYTHQNIKMYHYKIIFSNLSVHFMQKKKSLEAVKIRNFGKNIIWKKSQCFLWNKFNKRNILDGYVLLEGFNQFKYACIPIKQTWRYFFREIIFWGMHELCWKNCVISRMIFTITILINQNLSQKDFGDPIENLNKIMQTSVLQLTSPKRNSSIRKCIIWMKKKILHSN